MANDRKRELRKHKQEVKKAGNRKRRRILKEDLRLNPDEACQDDSHIEFGSEASKQLNGLDRDLTRKAKDD